MAQQYATDEAGNVWDVSDPSNPVFVRAGGGAAPQPVTVGTPNPYALPKDAADLERTRQQITQDATTAPYTTRTAAAQAARAEAEAVKAQRDIAADQSTASPQQQRAMAALGNDEILAAIGKARENLGRFGSAGFAARLPELLQPQSTIDLAGSLNTIASRLTLDKLAQLKQASPTGASGLGSLTEREGALLRDSVAGLGQTQSPDQLRESLASVERHYRNFTALAAGEDYRDPRVAEKYGIAQVPQQDRMTFAQGAYREEADPALQGVNAHIRGMIGAGKSAGEITAYMNSVQPGLGDQRAGDVAAAVRFRAQNPTVPLDQYPISVENRAVPMSGVRQTLNRMAQTPFGAGVIAAGDTITAGTMDNMTGNPALARAGMQASSDLNPTAAVLGGLAGGALAGGGLELAASRAGAVWAPRVADALYGAAYGAGSTDEGNRFTGALAGAGTGVAGGMFGRTLARGAGNALTGVRDASAQHLRAAGVPLTFGQAVANAGPLGARIKAREDRLAGFQGVGDRIGAQRRAGLEAFNRAAYNEGLAPIGAQGFNQVGEAAVEQADQLVSDAYARALGNVQLRRDQPFGADMQGPIVAANRLPGEMGANARYTLNERVGNGFDPNGVMTGNGFQQSVRGLEQDARAVRNQPYGNDFGNVTRGARGALENLLDRQAPGALPAYLDANAAYRNHSVLADATARAMNSDGIFTPAQLGQAARQNARTFTGRISAATTDRPFYDLQRAGQQLLPSKLPDSGTAGRADAGNEGLAGYLRRIARNVRNAPLYSETTQGALNTALLDRPAWAIAAGEAVARRARYGGLFGRPIALDYGPTAVAPGY